MIVVNCTYSEFGLRISEDPKTKQSIKVAYALNDYPMGTFNTWEEAYIFRDALIAQSPYLRFGVRCK